MSYFSKTLFFKRFSILISIIIVSLILWNTYAFFQKFKQQERVSMEILAEAQKQLGSNTDLNANVTLPLKILENNNTIPMILVDEKGAVINTQNLDSLKALKPVFLEEQLAIMKDGSMHATTLLPTLTAGAPNGSPDMLQLVRNCISGTAKTTPVALYA